MNKKSIKVTVCIRLCRGKKKNQLLAKREELLKNSKLISWDASDFLCSHFCLYIFECVLCTLKSFASQILTAVFFCVALAIWFFIPFCAKNQHPFVFRSSEAILTNFYIQISTAATMSTIGTKQHVKLN